MSENVNVAEIFGSNVFNDAVMKERLPKAVYKELKKTIELGKDLKPTIADTVANAMKDWAIEKGATHYTHWFQPMTGITAEKHDSFISPTADGKVLMEFSGKELIKGEPDASSFPSGGLRATNEARGYTAWDCTSPAFVKESPDGSSILCIPTAFSSYTGEALDKKIPLLRSMEAVNVQALRVLKLFGNTTSTKVITSVGPEQEYFLIDKADYAKRKDLIFTGRTLFGAMPPKGQELDDHYFGTVRERVLSYMKDLNIELWKLGVTAKTQHNEVAPAQHELAPIYGTTNIGTDHNQLVMETMKRVADRHNLACLLHEKPFAGVNGSGKHNNWSMGTDDGINLLEPGKTPHENVQFLLFLVAILKAVDEHADLLRLSASSAGNDHRLGANEAPPAIISVYLGEQLDDVLKQLDTTGEATSSLQGKTYESGVSTLPSFMQDATDRNRTSPFAFTGNKFEFRMVGSTQSIATPNTILNTIVADSLCEIADELEKADNFDMAVHDKIKELIAKHKRIIFNGNGYSEEWVAEAERRGLPNIKCLVDAVCALVKEENVAMFEKFSVLSKAELESRAEIYYENYAKQINIEAKTMLDMAKKQIVPAVMKYSADTAKGVVDLKAAGVDTSVQEGLLKDIAVELKTLTEAIGRLEKVDGKALDLESDMEKAAKCFHDEVFPVMEEVREPADKLESLVDKAYWPFPQYEDILFYI
ncbi:MAG: glutamine synthetase III [Bacteroidales bacterium]|nr:glutamine synthetase III [Clostridium sp.]MCM1204545.1 glutamine synthetase III [Bacteroidales bacterium]